MRLGEGVAKPAAVASSVRVALSAPTLQHDTTRCNTIQHGATQYANGATVQYCLDVRLPDSLATFVWPCRSTQHISARSSICMYMPAPPSPFLACRHTQSTLSRAPPEPPPPPPPPHRPVSTGRAHKRRWKERVLQQMIALLGGIIGTAGLWHLLGSSSSRHCKACLA